jgi:Tol biopolymer transport system component
MPSGQTVLYTNCLRECEGGISAIDIDGKNPRVILPNISGSYNDAVPSPDGKRLAFMKWHVKGIMMGIYLIRLGAEPEHPVTAPELEGWAPDWSPDGEKILFSSNIFENRPNGAIYSIRPDGQDIQQLTYPTFPLEDWSASYSPNGARIVFNSDRQYPDRCCGDLFTMRADESDGHNDAHEGEQRRLIRRVPLPVQAYDPRWGIAPLLPEATANVSGATVNPRAVPPGRAAAMRNVCRAFPVLARTPLCHK